MPHVPSTVENLMKVSLSVQTVLSGQPDGTPAQFEFIYGVGPKGITPLEKALFGKAAGDQIHLEIPVGEFGVTIGHLHTAMTEQTGIVQAGGLRIIVDRVVRADDREVVKAMASGGNCSDCGCGCGGH